MKNLSKILLILTLFCSSFINVFSQLSGIDPLLQMARGPIPPLKSIGLSYSSYKLNPKIAGGVFNALKSKNINLKESDIVTNLSIKGLRKVNENADYTINYTVSRFKLNLSDRIPKTHLKAPSYHIGFESSLEIFDKNSSLIYSRYNPVHSNTYLIDSEVTFDKLIKWILFRDFDDLTKDFKSDFLYQPEITSIPSVNVRKKKKSTSTFNVEEFDAMVQKLNDVLLGDKTKYGELLPAQIEYWTKLSNYIDESDEKVQKDVVSGALTQLALISLFKNDLKNVNEAIPQIKNIEPRIFFEAAYTPFFIRTLEEFEKEKIKEKQESISINTKPSTPKYLETDQGFTEFKTLGTIVYKDKSYTGVITIDNPMPDIIDWRTKQSTGLAAALLSDPVPSRIEVYSPEATKIIFNGELKNLSQLTDSSGNVFFVTKLGGVMEGSLGVSNNHFGLVSEIGKHKNITLLKEYFPSQFYVFKKDGEKNSFVLPDLLYRKKSIINYFGCQYITENTNSGKYYSNDQETYKALFKDYQTNCN